MNTPDVIDMLGLTVEEAEQVARSWVDHHAGQLTRRIADAIAAALEQRRPISAGDLVALATTSLGPWRVLAIVDGWALIRFEGPDDNMAIAVRVERLRRWPA